MVLSSIPNEWPQVMDEMGTNNLMSSSSPSSSPSSARPMDQTKLPATQDHHLPLKCPRCDSLNTKFCYYNNYSLSQPRHFCKACKRYWTRGGTLRNVPVGGGYRKNKRAKRPSVSSAMASSGGNCTVSTATTTPLITVAKPMLLAPDHDDPVLHHINVSDSNHLNSLLCGVPNSLSYSNIDHHGQYSLGLMNYPSSAATWIHNENIQMQDMVSSSSSILSNLSLLGYSSSLSRAKSNDSLLSSSDIVHQQQKLALGDMDGDGASNIQALLSLEGMHMGAGFHGDVGMMNVRKGVKSEEISENQIGKKLEWGLISSQNPLIEPHGSSIASVYLNNPMSVGANWPDLAN